MNDSKRPLQRLIGHAHAVLHTLLLLPIHLLHFVTTILAHLVVAGFVGWMTTAVTVLLFGQTVGYAVGLLWTAAFFLYLIVREFYPHIRHQTEKE